MNDRRFGKVSLDSGIDIVRCSFLVQKSLTPLDLNTLEYSCRRPTPCTEESFQKLLGVEDRRVLFEYHLDVSHGLEKALKENDPRFEFSSTNNKFKTSVYKGVKVSDDYDYLSDLWPSIMSAIGNSPNKIAELKLFLPMIRFSAKYFGDSEYDGFARILQEECITDSKLVAEFIEACGRVNISDFLLLNGEEVEHMEYFLHHSQKMKIEMHFEMYYNCPVIRSLLHGKFKRAIALIKYGKMRKSMTDGNISHYISIFLCETVLNWIKVNNGYLGERQLCADNWSCVKKGLFLLLVYIFRYQMEYGKSQSFLGWESPDLGIYALRLMWRSLPEAYLTLSDIQSVWRPDSDPDQPTADHVYTFYKNKIMDGKNQEGPRSLQHLARCEIRGRLAANRALPDGIELLGLPLPSQEFLRLEN